MMKTKCKLLVLLFFCFTALLSAQTTITGAVTDAETGEPLIGANVEIKNKLLGTVTNVDGVFELTTEAPPPFTLVVSYVGYQTTEQLIEEGAKSLSFSLQPGLLLTSDVVVSASRVEERILESPVTIEKMDPITIRQTAAPDFYDGIAQLKGVQSFQGSLTFNSINTRGFGSNGNERFVQLIDGVDNSSPLLNFPMGNVVGLSELDAHSVELVPGAASALYGPNAFNGILLMRSKSPFEYPGLSVQTKYGLTDSDPTGSNGYYQVAARYAQRLGDRFAFKINAAYLEGTDWQANDYTTGRATLATPNPAAVGEPAFDGLNTYGDETQILLPMPALTSAFVDQLGPPISLETGIPLPQVQAMLSDFIPTLGTLDLRRTGLPEENLLDDDQARSLKLSGALHYRLTDAVELQYAYQFGQGSTVFQGGDRYVIRDFTQAYHKVEVQHPDFRARAYATLTGAGDSYNLSAVGAYANEAFSPTEDEWAPTYGGAFIYYLLPYYTQGADITPALAEAHAFARAAADAKVPAVDAPAFNQVVSQVRSNMLGSDPPGAAFYDKSRLYHAELNYDLSRHIDVLDIQLGGNFRRYDLFSDGTVYNENPDGEGDNERIDIDEYGMYAQFGKRLFANRLKLTGSLRYDKNENFEGQVSPRLSAVYTTGKEREHNVRASFQTGFRNPTTQDQYIFFPLGDIFMIGSTEANAGAYGFHHGGAYTNASYQAFLQSALMGQPNPNLLEVIDLEFIQPEQIQVFELGYKGLIEEKLLLDVNAYFNRYENFIAQEVVRPIDGFTHQGAYLPGVNDMLTGAASSAIGVRAMVNAEEVLTSWGAGLGLAYELPADFKFYGHYNYTDYEVDDPGPDFESRFNMPLHKFTVGLAHRRLFNGKVGFDLHYRWQDTFRWESTFGATDIPSIGLLNAQVNYTVKPLRTTVKLGATNLLGDDYRNNMGGPFIGQLFYLGLTYDQFLN